MVLSEFILLTQSEKINLLYEKGVFVGKRIDGKQSVALYQLDSFYIEIYYKKYRTFISHLHYSSSTKILNAYLHQINIDGIISCIS